MTPTQLAEYRRLYNARQDAMRSGVRLLPGTPADPEPRTLDVVAAKVGSGFPALGIAVRDAWISAA